MAVYSKKKFWGFALERAIKSAAQTGIVFIGAEQLNVVAFDWATLGGFVLGGAVLSLLTSVASAPVGDDNSPSMV